MVSASPYFYCAVALRRTQTVRTLPPVHIAATITPLDPQQGAEVETSISENGFAIRLDVRVVSFGEGDRPSLEPPADDKERRRRARSISSSMAERRVIGYRQMIGYRFG